MKSFNGLQYDDKVFSLEWIGAKGEPMEKLKEAEMIFDKLIANAKRIIRAGVGEDCVSFFKGWKLTLKGGQYGGKKSSHDKGTEVRQESD